MALTYECGGTPLDHNRAHDLAVFDWNGGGYADYLWSPSALRRPTRPTARPTRVCCSSMVNRSTKKQQRPVSLRGQILRRQRRWYGSEGKFGEFQWRAQLPNDNLGF